MTEKTTEPSRAAELARVRAEFDKVFGLASNLLRGTERPGHELKGEALTRFLEADEKASLLRRRIQELEEGV